MDLHIAKEVINLLRSEQERRASHFGLEDGEWADDQWTSDKSFINELCLMLLVALHHHIGKEEDRFKRAERKQTSLPKQGRKKRDRYDAVPVRGSIGEALRVLANCYKHDSGTPSKELLRALNMPMKPEDQRISYDVLSDSELFREGLAKFLKLNPDSDFCAIAETFINKAEEYLNTKRVAAPPVDPKSKVSLRRFTG